MNNFAIINYISQPSNADLTFILEFHIDPYATRLIKDKIDACNFSHISYISSPITYHINNSIISYVIIGCYLTYNNAKTIFEDQSVMQYVKGVYSGRNIYA